MTRLRTPTALLTLVALLLATASAALAAPAPRTSLSDVEHEVMCVACGVPLEIADSPQADRERALIRTLIAQGKTKAQVKDALVAQYGPRVLGTPQDKGFGLAAYLVPIALVLLALIAAAIVLPKWRARERSSGMLPEAAGPALSDEDARRLDADLARYDV